MAFEEEGRASSQPPIPMRMPAPVPVPVLQPAPTADTASSSSLTSFSSVVSLAQRMARIRAEVDALALVLPRDLDGAGALALFDGVFELSDRLQAIAVQALPVVESGVP